MEPEENSERLFSNGLRSQPHRRFRNAAPQ